jgi:nitroreductase
MKFLELVQRRFSVRNFLEKPVEQELLLQVLEAGRLAPSACNNQPAVFILLQDEKSRNGLQRVYNRPWFLSAPVILAVCCDRSLSWHRNDGKDYGDVDIAIALDHITLAATEIGLGTCWVGSFNEKEARDLLMLPSHIDPVAFTPIGYPSKEAPSKVRKKIDDMVHWEVFGNKIH